MLHGGNFDGYPDGEEWRGEIRYCLRCTYNAHFSKASKMVKCTYRLPYRDVE
jgi:hypothetical protein